MHPFNHAGVCGIVTAQPIDDGYEAELSLDKVRGCADCIVAFNDGGGFSMVLSGFPGNVQVKDIIEVKVQ